MVAGEASGDLLAGLLLEGMRSRWPGMQAQGIGGPRMTAQGFDAWWPHDKLAVRGYVEVLMHYREIVGIRKQLAQRLMADPPRAFIGVDAPDFNLDLEGQLREKGVKTVHFICPSIWAWRADRVHKIKRSVDHVLCVFPFEPQLLEQHGIGATYVGHPLANVIAMEPDKAAARASLGLADGDEVLAVLPGSRGSEVKYHTQLFLEAAALVAKARPGLKIVVPAMPAFKPAIESAARTAGLTGAMILEGQSHAVLAACDVTLIASGTATLEAALFKRPMVISYAMNWLTYRMMKPHQVLPWFGLPNILLREFAVPELIQQDAKPPALARALLDWFESPDRMAAVQDKFRALHIQLQRDTAQLATDAIDKVIHA
ncbi:MAG: lipid-A-disaccharide synthase [Ramlibacter sp.]|nr:lipid-A-disaccharide synthase [Ramlibacter sp.]